MSYKPGRLTLWRDLVDLADSAPGDMGRPPAPPSRSSCALTW